MKADVAIVGAGLAGIVCARRLVEAGQTVVLFDKGRKAGGRLSSRRTDFTRFDHGAALFTADEPAFQAEVEAWEAAGFVKSWNGRFVKVASDATRSAWHASAWVGVPAMSSIPGALAEGLDVRPKVRVGRIARSGQGWMLDDEHGASLGVFSSVIVNTPCGQAAPLLEDVPPLRAAADAVEMEPCWAVMVVPEQPWETGFDAAEFASGPLFRAFSQASKPGRDETPGWVLHASGDWTKAQWELPPQSAIDELVGALHAACGASAEPVGSVRFARAHRWRYARSASALRDACLWDGEVRAGACGDWCGGPGLQGAWRSGHALADRMI